MDSTEHLRLERRLRRKYELGRLRRALVGVAPAVVLVLLAAAVATRPLSTTAFGIVMVVVGVALLWYGRELRRALLPGLGAGCVPLVLAICANHYGHVCTGSGCTSLCMSACVAGGATAGLLVAGVGHKRRQGVGFWIAASSVALLTGAMGCACIGYTGLAGLVLGYGVGMVPALTRTGLGRFSG